MRIKAVVSYNGAVFYGFQTQKTTQKTVLGTLIKAAKKIGIDSTIVGSGRTDKGVHATGQVIHFDIPTYWQNDYQRLKTVYNRLLSPHIQIKTITPASDTFHARFDAKRRIYRYIFKSTPTTPFESLYMCHLPYINHKKLKVALKLFEGKYDFCYFHKQGSDPTSTIRTIFKTNIKTFRQYTILYIEANGFLRSQARMIIKACVDYMQDNLALQQIKEQLRGKAVHSTNLVPPQGLYLSRVIY